MFVKLSVPVEDIARPDRAKYADPASNPKTTKGNRSRVDHGVPERDNS